MPPPRKSPPVDPISDDRLGRFSTTVPSLARRSRWPRILAWLALLLCVGTSAFLIGTVLADESRPVPQQPGK